MNKARLKDNIPNSCFRSFFEQYFPELCYFANNIIQDFNQSEDITQDIFVRYWEIHNNFPNDIARKAWLYKSTRNKCLDYLKSKNHSQIRIDIIELITNESPQPINKLELEDIKKRYLEALERLTPLSSKIFKMNRHLGLSYNAIAHSLNISIKTVEYHMHKALLIMKKYLSEFLHLFF